MRNDNGLSRTTYEADLAVRTIMADLADVTAAATRKHAITKPDGTTVLDASSRRKIMAEVDAFMDAQYGIRKGMKNTPMAKVFETMTNRAQRRAIEGEVQALETQLEDHPDLLAAMRKGE